MAVTGLVLVMLVLMVTTDGALGDAKEDKATKEVTRRFHDPALYDNTLRPPSPGGTGVEIQVYFREIDIDDVKMRANFDITFRMLWNDSRLAYNTAQDINLMGVEYISLLDPAPLWIPDAFFKNAEVSQYESIHPEQFLRVYPDGRLVYSTRISLLQSCPMDLARFPHDTQVCDIKIASYGYTVKDIRFMLASKESVTFGSDIHADRFHFEDYLTDACNSRTATGEYSCVQVSMKIRRQFGTYLLEWYLPCMFLVLVAWFSFLVPGDQFLGRVLLTLVPLIALASFSLEYKKSLASVPYICAMDTFSGISLCVIFLTLLYVIVSYVQDSNKKKGEEEEEKAAGSPEEGEANRVKETAEGGWMRRLARRVRQRADYLSRVFLVSAYIFFLFVYFVAYCGTG